MVLYSARDKFSLRTKYSKIQLTIATKIKVVLYLSHMILYFFNNTKFKWKCYVKKWYDRDRTSLFLVLLFKFWTPYKFYQMKISNMEKWFLWKYHNQLPVKMSPTDHRLTFSHFLQISFFRSFIKCHSQQTKICHPNSFQITNEKLCPIYDMIIFVRAIRWAPTANYILIDWIYIDIS